MVANIHLGRLYRRSSSRHHGWFDTHTAVDGLFRSGRPTSPGKIYRFSKIFYDFIILSDRFQQGLYGSFFGCLLYVFLGTCKEVPMGPTAIVSLMTYNSLHGLGPVYATLLCFLSGVLQLIMGVVGLGTN